MIPACPACGNPTLYRVGQSEGVQPLPAVGGGTEALEAYRCERDCDGGLEHAPRLDRWFVADLAGRLYPHPAKASTPREHAVAAPALTDVAPARPTTLPPVYRAEWECAHGWHVNEYRPDSLGAHLPPCEWCGDPRVCLCGPVCVARDKPTAHRIARLLNADTQTTKDD